MSDIILPLKSYDDEMTKCNNTCKPQHSETWGDILDPVGGLGRPLAFVCICCGSVTKN